MKEIWEIDPAKHKEGTVTHTMGWPLNSNAGGGSFIYHLENNQVYVGFVVHLNYKNPHVFPYMEFQRFKHHPMVAELLKGGKRVAYGARAITEGGYQSMPKLRSPVWRCWAVRLAWSTCRASRATITRCSRASPRPRQRMTRSRRSVGRRADDYETDVREGAIGKDLKKVRNVKPLWSQYGLARVAGHRRLGHVAQHTWLLAAGTLSTANPTPTRPKKRPAQGIDYPNPTANCRLTA